jgi:hypothetical protein
MNMRHIIWMNQPFVKKTSTQFSYKFFIAV